MVMCVCGKPMDKVPSWLNGVTIQFVCNNCPNRTVKGITQVTFETAKEPGSEIEALDDAEAEDEDAD